MKTFRDNADRTWVVSINVNQVKRVRGLLGGFDIYGLVNDGFQGLAALLNDPIQLVDVLYVLCKEEADKLGVSDEDFGRAMAGDAIEHAADAFVNELSDFFPDPRLRAGLKKVFAKTRMVRDRLLIHMSDEIDNFDVDVLVTKLIESSGSSPASSDSTPVRSPSAN